MTTCRACWEPLDPVTGIRVHPTCESSPDAAISEVFDLVQRAIVGQPRNTQKRIGPSEMGVPCDRRIGYKLAGVPEVNDRGVAWKPYVGTSVHEQMATIMARDEVDRMQREDYEERWLVEERVSVGHVNGVEITGSCDLFDQWQGAVWDWKFTTRNKIRESYRPHGPGEQYRVQAHLYGRGMQRAGREVRSVGIVFLTRDGEWTDRHVWHEPYDEQVAIAALERASSIALAIDALGPDFTLPTLPTADAYCNFCPWHKTNATTLSRSCPGHPREAQATQSLATLIGA
jgi:hypothetical protein